ncbi:hypothetical protein FACS189472_00470 [Alphaproteobacteria bacterium]|nr:hypothetical protein FACS189472_00470 [Alphaproteobacteria bacterium]
MNIREIVFLSLFSAVGVLEAANCSANSKEPSSANENAEAKKPDEDKLLHEIFNDAAGINCPFSFDGCLNFTSLYISQNDEEKKDAHVPGLEGEINLKYCDKTAEYSYGADVKIKASSGVIKDGSPIVRDSSVFLRSENIGTLKLGYTKTAAKAFLICSGNSLVGYGGPDSGNLHLFYNESAGSIVETGFPNDDSKAAKLVYLSPNFSGFTFGLSFTPDSRTSTPFKTKHMEQGSDEISEEEANRLGSTTSYSKNIITGGLAYEFGDKDGLKAKIAAAAWFGKGKTTIEDKKVDDVKVYNIGATVGYKDFEVSLGYTDCGKSLLSKYRATKNITTFDPDEEYKFLGMDEEGEPIGHREVGLKDGADAGKIYSIGASYSFDKLKVSTGYYKSFVKFSDTEKAKADIVTLAAEYTVNKTMSIYAEYDNISTDTCARAQAYRKACKKATTGKNKANVYMIGTKINL